MAPKPATRAINSDHENKILDFGNRLLTEHDVADMLNIKVSTLRAWRVKGSPIPFCQIGRNIRYSPEAVSDYLKSTFRSSTTNTCGVPKFPNHK